MTLYSAILFLHVIAAFGLVGAITVEAIALRQLGHLSGTAGGPAFPYPSPRLRSAGSICLLLLLLTGGYLTDRLSMWTLAWPKVAVLVVFVFGALAGMSGKRLGQLQRAARSAQQDRAAPENVRQFLKTSLSLRAGLVLAEVFLMTIKPNLSSSIGAVLGFALISAGVVGSMNMSERKAQSETPDTIAAAPGGISGRN